jgi:hypothetical protein
MELWYRFLTPSTPNRGTRFIFFPYGGVFLMSIHAIVPPLRHENGHESGPLPERSPLSRARKGLAAPAPIHFPAQSLIEEGTYRQAEL